MPKKNDEFLIEEKETKHKCCGGRCHNRKPEIKNDYNDGEDLINLLIVGLIVIFSFVIFGFIIFTV